MPINEMNKPIKSRVVGLLKMPIKETQDLKTIQTSLENFSFEYFNILLK